MEDSSSFPTSRRTLLAGLAFGAAAAPLKARPDHSIRAIAFDAFVLFDPSAILHAAQRLVGAAAPALVSTASAKLFAYTWFYTSAGRYAPFTVLAEGAFRSAADVHKLVLDDAGVGALVGAYSALSIWPDVAPALELLRGAGVRLVVLSNLPEPLLRKNLESTGISSSFEHVLSTDRARRFKPAPEAYALAPKSLKLGRSQIGFAASASWDASGSRWFGFPTLWVNRNAAPIESAHQRPDIVSRGMDGVLRLAERGPGV